MFVHENTRIHHRKKHLADSSVVYSDETFNVALHLFHQLHFIHGEFRGQVFPCVYCLKENGKEKDMRQFCNSLKHSYRPDATIRTGYLKLTLKSQRIIQWPVSCQILNPPIMFSFSLYTMCGESRTEIEACEELY